MLTRFHTPIAPQLENIDVLAEGIFANNIAATSHTISPLDMERHATHIKTTSFSALFTNAYNNYDIGYRDQSVNVSFKGNGGVILPNNNIRKVFPSFALGNTMPGSPTREGYKFTGWNTESNGSGNGFSKDTVVNSDLVVYAQWKKSSSPSTSTPDDNYKSTTLNPSTANLNAGNVRTADTSLNIGNLIFVISISGVVIASILRLNKKQSLKE